MSEVIHRGLVEKIPVISMPGVFEMVMLKCRAMFSALEQPCESGIEPTGIMSVLMSGKLERITANYGFGLFKPNHSFGVYL